MDGPAATLMDSNSRIQDALASPWLFTIAALIVAVLVLGRDLIRGFDVDEHQFVAPAVLLTGKALLPYSDYPYFHMPTQIYAFAALTGWTSYKLLAARLFAGLCGVATLFLLFGTGWRALAGQTPSCRWLLAGGVTLAYMTSQLFTYTSGWTWNHDAAVLCAFGAFLTCARGLRHGNVPLIGLAGALIPLPLALAVCLGASPLSSRQRCLALLLAVLGAGLVLLPALRLWSLVPDRFLFGNLGYPRISTLFYQSINHGAMTWTGKALYFLRKFLSDPGNALFLLVVGYSLGYAYWKMTAWRSAFANELGLLLGLMPVLVVGVWGPSPAQQQYFYMLLPFFALAGIYTMALQAGRAESLARWRRIALLAAVLPGCIGLVRWYWPVVYVPFPENWTPDTGP